MRKLIYKLKYDSDLLIAEDLSILLTRMLLKLPESVPGSAALLPVPLHPNRLRSRGFNQSEYLCRKTARKLGLKLETRALRRIKETIPQHGLGQAERAQNMSGAFSADPRLAGGRDFLIVDDIFTSGSTLREAALALKAAGASSVHGLTLARALLGDNR